MAGFIAKQPNGLYCRFSTVTDCPTNWNMTEEDYIKFRMEQAKEDAIYTLKNHLRPFDLVVESFVPINMSEEEFEEFLEDTKDLKERKRR